MHTRHRGSGRLYFSVRLPSSTLVTNFFQKKKKIRPGLYHFYGFTIKILNFFKNNVGRKKKKIRYRTEKDGYELL